MKWNFHFAAFPDTSKFLYDEIICYYYDPLTGLLYEPNTRYFFDRVTQQYFHYDASKSIYVPASQVANQQNQGEAAKNEEPTKKKEKKEKEKTAQKIAKEMEKWAKRMNSQKDAPLVVPKVEQTIVSVGLEMLEYCSYVGCIGCTANMAIQHSLIKILIS